jgi:hypothetical protein
MDTNASAALATPNEYPEYVRTEWKLLAERRLACPGTAIADLAVGLGYNPVTVRIWLRTPAYQRYENWLLSERRAELVDVPTPESPRFRGNTIGERFGEYQYEMQERLLDIIQTTRSEKLQADLVEKWLAYGGTVPKAAVNAGVTGPAISVDKLIVFAQRANEVGLPLEALAALVRPRVNLPEPEGNA